MHASRAMPASADYNICIYVGGHYYCIVDANVPRNSRLVLKSAVRYEIDIEDESHSEKCRDALHITYLLMSHKNIMQSNINDGARSSYLL